MGLYFDGRSDNLYQQVEARYYKRTVLEEHVALVEEPGSHYVGHTPPTSGSGNDLARSIPTCFN